MKPEIKLSLKEMATRNFKLRKIPVRVSSGVLALFMAGSLGVEAKAVDKSNTKEVVTMSQLDDMTKENGSGEITQKYDLSNYYSLDVMSNINLYVNDVPYVDPYGAPNFQYDGVTYSPLRMVRYLYNMDVSYSNGVVNISTKNMTGLTSTNTNKNKKDEIKKSTSIVIKDGVKVVVDGKPYTITQKGFNNSNAKVLFVGYLEKDANGKESFVGQTVYIPLRDIIENIAKDTIQPDNGNVYVGTHVKTTSPVVTPTTPTNTLVYPNLSDELNTKLNKYYNLVIHIQPYMDEVNKIFKKMEDLSIYAYNKKLALAKLLETNNSSELQNYYNQISSLKTEIVNLAQRNNAMISSSQLASIKLRFDKMPKTVTEADYYGKYGSLEDLINFCASQLESFDSDLAYIRINCTDSIIKNYYSQIDTIYNAAMKSVKTTSNTINDTETEGYSYVIEKTYDPIA